jgi:hypothetical protein
LVDTDMVEKRDLKLFDFAESAEEIWDCLTARGLEIPKRRARK